MDAGSNRGIASCAATRCLPMRLARKKGPSSWTGLSSSLCGVTVSHVVVNAFAIACASPREAPARAPAQPSHLIEASGPGTRPGPPFWPASLVERKSRGQRAGKHAIQPLGRGRPVPIISHRRAFSRDTHMKTSAANPAIPRVTDERTARIVRNQCYQRQSID
jgi:hypothetical protein